jgi:hypothetical protein
MRDASGVSNRRAATVAAPALIVLLRRRNALCEPDPLHEGDQRSQHTLRYRDPAEPVPARRMTPAHPPHRRFDLRIESGRRKSKTPAPDPRSLKNKPRALSARSAPLPTTGKLLPQEWPVPSLEGVGPVRQSGGDD